MAFVDEAKIKVMAGGGGNGAVAFQRQPFQPKGGPDGGDGGDGGSVVLVADTSVGTLLDIRDHPHITADRGGHGEGKRRHGKRGADRRVRVPVGTVIYDEDVLLADLAAPGDEFIAARGGKGGRGNAQFATPTRRAPAFSEKGEPGDDRWLRLELRLLADIGLVGFPNAGKSTLISVVSAAKPKIADYPFTTLVPNLGVVKHGDSSFVVADIPGILPGASEGKGLGHQFLRHVRRAALLLFMVDLAAEDRDPAEDVAVLAAELEAFDPELAARPRLIAVTKIDAFPDRLAEVVEKLGAATPNKIFAISAVTGEGMPELLRAMTAGVERSRSDSPAAIGYVRHVVREEPLSVVREGEAWRVLGKRAERAVETTDMSNDESVERLQRRLIGIGVERVLEREGAKRGDDVRIADIEFEFEPEGYAGEDEEDETLSESP